jgi:hypothetical protein
MFQVICSVLQLINQIIKDNTDFQENACLVGLVSPMYFIDKVLSMFYAPFPISLFYYFSYLLD